jgi:hypothetical protein
MATFLRREVKRVTLNLLSHRDSRVLKSLLLVVASDQNRCRFPVLSGGGAMSNALRLKPSRSSKSDFSTPGFSPLWRKAFCLKSRSSVMLDSVEINDSLMILVLNIFNYLIKNKRRFLYVLKDPRTDVVRYVGSTANPATRFMWHLHETPNPYRFTKKQNWLHTLKRLKLKPVLEYKGVCKPEEARYREQLLIAEYVDTVFNTRNAIAIPRTPKTSR